MNKLLLLISIILIRVNAQTTPMDSVSTSNDTVNIHQLVQEQISKVQENKSKSTLKPVDISSDWGTSNNQNGIGGKDILSTELIFKFAAIILAMMISLGYVVIKRKKAPLKKHNKLLKENISNIRKEKPIRRERNDLSIIRENLRKNAVYLSPHDREISKSAKELKIAKGELYLAADLKSLELTKIGNKKIKMVEML